MVMITLLAGGAEAKAALYFGVDTFAGDACVGILDPDHDLPWLNEDSGDCADARAEDGGTSWLIGRGDGPLGEFTDVIVGVDYAGVDECFSVGSSGVQPCNFWLPLDILGGGGASTGHLP
jgi:hypothetical protein